MSDFDTRRIGEIAELEEQIKALKTQVAQYKSAAEKWEPKVSCEAFPGEGRVTLSFGGKVMAATMTENYLLSTDLTSATSAIVDTLSNSLLADRIRDVIRPSVEALIANMASTTKAGKW